MYGLEPDGSLVVHADLRHIAEGPVNDMYVDKEGRSYVGHFGFDHHAFLERHPNMLYAPPGPPRAPIACFSPQGELIGLSEPLAFTNGLFPIDEGRTMLVAETLAMRLVALPVLADGRQGPPRPWPPLDRTLAMEGGHQPRTGRQQHPPHLRPPGSPGHRRPLQQPHRPGGIAPGNDGMAWVANVPRDECVRVGGPGGTILERVSTSQRTLSCLVAGPKGDTLYAATVRTDDPRRARELNGSRIEAYVLPS
ncbi:SMP-30/gluconolactonase/LRE family protein [Streptomyces sp. NPDC059690]|uniref:SMP-30/gluconolactonase/LRE family protein n=1 Tax=Streptomyces sp. NPDC059690 TaxID=3346907 RepID=UPI003688271B